MRTLGVINLARSQPDVSGWRVLRSATRRVQGTLPVGSLITPAGYAFFEPAQSAASGDLRVVVASPGESRGIDEPASRRSVAASGQRSIPPVKLRADELRGRNSTGCDGLVLQVGSDEARIEVNPDDWDLVAAPILLAIAQCWRFLEIDRQLDELADWVRATSERTSRRLFTADWNSTDTRFRTFQQLLLELPGVEGPLTDPRGYLPSRREAQLYRLLARGLGLTSWRALIDERIEVVEATLTHLAEERRTGMALRASLILEVLILLVLLADVAINLVLVFIPE